MNPDPFCTSDQWSMIASAPSTSQLAGVLGGFLITAIALLFDRNSREGIHTLALFRVGGADPDAQQLSVQSH
ncbi:hypothetical protein [Mycobacterium sherrisii]|uniref:hypothetical protein n=1 Tax=Mycobacterium sherrisii TaxID=243061 RepID=UPI000A7F6273|nr:hypothetical protein [Mycobacterium sherrisii]MEC4762942.1 hypothetical protein [Mycobacterium sherrisii]